MRPGWPRPGEAVAVWGDWPVAWRGRMLARMAGVPVLRVEDGFLRSVLPGAGGDPPISLTVDGSGLYCDARGPSDLETMIREDRRLDDPALTARARGGIGLLRRLGLSKYTAPADAGALPPPGYALVVDQTAGDASVRGGLAAARTFARMLDAARETGLPVVVKAHPDARGAKRGHFRREDLRSGEVWLDRPVPVWALLDGATRVFTVSSQLGYEAVLAGRPVTCFGRPFYAGWGLTEDRVEGPRRGVPRAPEQLFLAAHLLFPVYYDPIEDSLTTFETAAERIATRRAHRARFPRDVAVGGCRSWKHGPLRRFAAGRDVRFHENAVAAIEAAADTGRDAMVWAGKVGPATLARADARGLSVTRVEDGFIRSRGLGAALTPPASLVFDRSGIYYDPTGPSDLERLIEARAWEGHPGALPRARALISRLRASGATKYNVGRQAALPSTDRPVILVPGQVADDASIRLGTHAPVTTNLALVHAARAANPDACLIYKPHPDVEAGLRTGGAGERDIASLADHVARDADPAALIARADAVWTLTSLMGFEALVRETPVTCLGTPFYAGWGLTTDLGPQCPRRTARPTLDALVWAALIAYPLYRDPASGEPCEVETLLDRLEAGVAVPPHLLGALARRFARFRPLWA